jgi:hypothetical protein
MCLQVSFLNGSERTSDVFAVEDGTVVRIFTVRRMISSFTHIFLDIYILCVKRMYSIVNIYIFVVFGHSCVFAYCLKNLLKCFLSLLCVYVKTSDWLQMDSRIKAAFAERIAVLGLKIRSQNRQESPSSSSSTTTPPSSHAKMTSLDPLSVVVPSSSNTTTTTTTTTTDKIRSPRVVGNKPSPSPKASKGSPSHHAISPRKLKAFTFNLDKKTQINETEKKINTSKLVEHERENDDDDDDDDDDGSSSSHSTLSSSDDDQEEDAKGAKGGGGRVGINHNGGGGGGGGGGGLVSHDDMDFSDVVDGEVTIQSEEGDDSLSLNSLGGDSTDLSTSTDGGSSVNYFWMSPI